MKELKKSKMLRRGQVCDLFPTSYIYFTITINYVITSRIQDRVECRACPIKGFMFYY